MFRKQISLVTVLFSLLMILFLLNARQIGAATVISFTGEELLGKPTDTSITINIIPASNIEYYYEYGTSAGGPYTSTALHTATGGQPDEVVLTGLSPNTRYYYRMRYHAPGEGSSDWITRDEHTFHTQRAEGETFTFTIISDSHAMYNTQYQTAIGYIAEDLPDFHMDLGDTFMTDNATSQTTVNNAYLAQREPLYMDAIGHSSPIFLASGNHENEEGWNLDDDFSIALASIKARKAYFPTPVTDGFYTGNEDPLPAINAGTYGDQLREDYYAWEWGDALFVVFDPFQYTMANPYGATAGESSDDPATGDRWNWSLGQDQYYWLKETLENSDAKYKFMFAHHMLGGTQNYVRGGAVPAHMFEWGGYGVDGTTWEFAAKRTNDPEYGFEDPIRQLMIENDVTAFFHGHDHQYAYEVRDGIVYLSMPRPSTGLDFNYYDEADEYTERVISNAGYLRVTVGPTEATAEYVRSSTTGVSHEFVMLPNIAGESHDLTMAVQPAGSGTTSPSAGVHAVAADSDVTVTAAANSGFEFDHWSGACSGSAACVVTMDSDKSVTANFTSTGAELSDDVYTLLLGRPTDNSVTVNAVLDQSGQVSFEYGTTSGSYTTQTSAFTATVDEPVETVFSGLSSDTQYFYRMRYRATSGDEWLNGTEHSFQTQRVRGESFTFTVSSDSHLGDTFSGIDPDRYEATTVNIANDDPDFHLDLGDAFVMNSPTNQDQADEIYLAQRPFFGNFSHSAPVFLAIGNHENEEGWNLDDTPFSKALGSITARKKYFLNPVTDAFYSGNDDPLPTAYGGGYREDYYAWEWGDALFVVLDPFQYTMTKPYENDPFNENETETGDQWDWTLGIDQYMWFKETLENSTAPYKFVFAHHMLGGVPYLSVGGADAGYVRGGAEAAPYFEWGGQNEDDTYGFTVERPSVTWGADPIHQIMLDNNVTIFFHGHDHQFVHEIRDGITYQEVPSSSMTGYGFDLYDDSPYAVSGGNLPNAGHLRIDVTADLATVRYVRAAIAGDTGITNGSVSYTYTVTPSVAGERLNGDANRDSSINSTDALVILSYDVGLDVPYTIDACSDINGDGFVNSTDALAILSNDAGITVPFPIGGICTLPQG